ncbi:MAG: molecular chaperone DnaJ [Patescibacteria group bacterium]|nr:molecular chaperone DnaJ [Patescibacteria group bacterium]
MQKDYYNILGVNKSSSADEIKKAFRKLAHKYHPDKKGGDETKFKEINEAYQVLSNPQKKQQYDQFGQTFDQTQAGGEGFSGFDDFSGFSGFNSGFSSGGGVEFDLGDILGDFFGGGRKTGRAARGRDIQADITIEFLEMITGAEKEIEIFKNSVCDNCGGTGDDPKSEQKICSTCNGKGEIKKMRQTMFGSMATSAICPDCNGEGKIASKKCEVCKGTGVIKEKEKIKIKIPMGINEGESIRISGKGEAIKKGAAGDLYIVIHIRQGTEFLRVGDDINTVKLIKLTQAILGDKIEVDTPEGKVKLKIPEGIESGTEFRLRGKGIPHLRGFGRGDLIIKIIITIPKRLTRAQKKIIKELEKEGL